MGLAKFELSGERVRARVVARLRGGKDVDGAAVGRQAGVADARGGRGWRGIGIVDAAAVATAVAAASCNQCAEQQACQGALGACGGVEGRLEHRNTAFWERVLAWAD
ncbi:hypothetical protein D3C86_1232560 [compost metagenome]